MRKSSKAFHSARQSSRALIRNIRGKLCIVDTCKAAHEVANDKDTQLARNPLLSNLLYRAGY